MTSTSFNVGLMDSRNSSRVLRPPGGGHTDIFGVTHEPPQKKVSEPINTKDVENGQEESPKTCDKPETDLSPKKNVSPEKAEETKPDEPPAVIPPQRRRIPPGGFSSGLW